MAMDLEFLEEPARSPSNLVIQRVGDAGALLEWCQTMSDGFGTNETVAHAFYAFLSGVGLDDNRPTRCYLGLLNGRPVATSILALGAGVAGV
jgi:hypothetical protein